MLDVVKSPNPILLQKCEACTPGDKSLKKLSKQMADVMYKYSGIGLAGPQVGQLKRIIVVDTEYDLEDKNTRNPITLINPEIIDKSEETEVGDEGCLSCPGVSAPVVRYKTIKVKYFDLSGNLQTIDAQDMLSRCLQHEIDHLDGKTLFQTALPESRIQLLKDYEIALANGAIPGEVN